MYWVFNKNGLFHEKSLLYSANQNSKWISSDNNHCECIYESSMNI